MLTAKAVFERKPVTLEARDCIIEKVIRLTIEEYDSFARRLTADRNFIRDNAELMRIDSEGKAHCILVVGNGRRDGILINSDGADYARQAAFFPDAESFLITERFPALAELNKKLVDVTEYIMASALKDLPNVTEFNRSAIDIEQVQLHFGIDFDLDFPYYPVIAEMLWAYDGVDAIELDNNDLYIYWDEPAEELSAPAPEKPVKLNDPESDPSLVYDAKRLSAWQSKVEANSENWREDTRYRKFDEGALYYIGGESGQYMKLTKDGKFMAGDYDGARPGIENAVLVYSAIRPFNSYEEAFVMAARLGGEKFAADMFGEASRVSALVDERSSSGLSRRQPAAGLNGVSPVTVQEGKNTYTSIVKTIEKAKTAPKAPRKTKNQDKDKAAKKKNRGDDSL